MTHTTVLLTIGAGRADYVTPQIMPFLHGLAKTGLQAELEPPAGYAQEETLFSGKYPDTAGRFTRYAFDPTRSPYQWVRPFGRQHGRAPLRPTGIPTRKAVGHITSWLRPLVPSDPARIPTTLLPYFAPAVDLQPDEVPRWHRTNDLFDLCRRRGLRYRYHTARTAKDDSAVHEGLVRDLRAGQDAALHAVRFTGPEETGRTHGPFSERQLRQELRLLDDRIASVHAAMTAGYDSATLVVCGDHGMAPVEREVDVLAALQQADAVAGKDYVVFVHSTMAAFWYLTERGQRAIDEALPRVEGATVVDPAAREAHRIPSDRLWGDRLLAADPGVVFRPDFFHAPDPAVRGMHGYLDKRTEGQAMALITATDRSLFPARIGSRPMVDMFPTLCDLLGLPTPYDQEGTSILTRADPTTILGKNGRNGNNGHHKKDDTQTPLLHTEP